MLLLLLVLLVLGVLGVLGVLLVLVVLLVGIVVSRSRRRSHKWLDIIYSSQAGKLNIELQERRQSRGGKYSTVSGRGCRQV